MLNAIPPTRPWDESILAAIATAMRAATWHDGQDDHMDSQRIKDYFKSKPLSVGPDKKTKGSPRWRSWSMVLVAETVHNHGVALRKLLSLDKEMEVVPTAAAVIAARDATIAERDATITEVKDELRKEKDKLRKAAERLTTARERKTTAVRAERQKQQEKAQEKIARYIEKEQQRLEKKEQLMKEGLEAWYADDWARQGPQEAACRATTRHCTGCIGCDDQFRDRGRVGRARGRPGGS